MEIRESSYSERTRKVGVYILYNLACASVQPDCMQSMLQEWNTPLSSPQSIKKAEPTGSTFFAYGGDKGVVLQRAHTKSKHFCRLLFAQACSLTRTKSVQGCTPLISATKIIKKQAERSTLLVFVVELKVAKTHTVLYQINRTEYYCQVDLPLSDYPLYGKQLVK